MTFAHGNTLVADSTSTVSRMKLEVPEVVEEALKATSRTTWIRKDLALSVGQDITTDPTIVSTIADIVGSEEITALRTAGIRMPEKETDLKKEKEEVRDLRAETGIQETEDNKLPDLA